MSLCLCPWTIWTGRSDQTMCTLWGSCHEPCAVSLLQAMCSVHAMNCVQGPCRRPCAVFMPRALCSVCAMSPTQCSCQELLTVSVQRVPNPVFLPQTFFTIYVYNWLLCRKL